LLRIFNSSRSSSVSAVHNSVALKPLPQRIIDSNDACKML
jgi:hypothetical protein